MASRRLAVAPRPSHTTALSRGCERTGADDHLGERGGCLYAPIIYIYSESYPRALSLLSRRLSAAYELVLLYCCSTSWVGRLWCVSVGGSVDLWVGGRAGSWLRAVHVNCSFAFSTHRAFVLPSLYRVAGLIDSWVTFVFFCPPAILAPRWQSSAFHH